MAQSGKDALTCQNGLNPSFRSRDKWYPHDLLSSSSHLLHLLHLLHFCDASNNPLVEMLPSATLSCVLFTRYLSPVTINMVYIKLTRQYATTCASACHSIPLSALTNTLSAPLPGIFPTQFIFHLCYSGPSAPRNPCPSSAISIAFPTRSVPLSHSQEVSGLSLGPSTDPSGSKDLVVPA